MGVGAALALGVLGLGDIEEDVHNVSGTSRDRSDLGTPGLSWDGRPWNCALGLVLVPGAAGPAATAAAHPIQGRSFSLRPHPPAPPGPLVSAGRAGKVLDQPRRVLPLTLLGLTQGCVEAAEAGTVAMGDLWGGPPGGPRSSSKTSRKGRHEHLSLQRKRAIGVRGS